MSKTKTAIDSKALIVQFADETKTLPDGSKVIYAESDDKIVLFHKMPLEKSKTYVYERKSGKIFINGKEGDNNHKREMIRLGSYLMNNAKDSDLVTFKVQNKGNR
jgi:hypothetical protein